MVIGIRSRVEVVIELFGREVHVGHAEYALSERRPLRRSRQRIESTVFIQPMLVSMDKDGKLDAIKKLRKQTSQKSADKPPKPT